MDEDVEFFAEGGRFPVKWLALECLRRRIFSHKSDVWAFGVTLWEVFTFGSRPYPDVRATELIDYLDRGERLLQPDICTLDIYMLMIKCWLADPEGRPTFEELVTDLSKMAADPARYLVVSVSFRFSSGRREGEFNSSMCAKLLISPSCPHIGREVVKFVSKTWVTSFLPLLLNLDPCNHFLSLLARSRSVKHMENVKHLVISPHSASQQDIPRLPRGLTWR